MSENPSPFIPAWLDDLGLTANQFRTYCHLRRRAGKDGSCHPSGPNIAKVCRINKDTVWKVISELEIIGLIVRMKHFRNSNRYLVRNSPLSSVGGIQGVTQEVESAESEGCQSAESKGWVSAESRGLQSAESEGCKGNPSKGIQLRESNEGLSIDGFSLETASDVSPKKTPPSTELAESIYQLYPRKVSKPDAITAIIKSLKTHSADFLREKVTAYASAITWQESRFIPHPATWFNKERFNDDPKEWEQPTNGNHKPPNTTVNLGNRRNSRDGEYPQPKLELP